MKTVTQARKALAMTLLAATALTTAACGQHPGKVENPTINLASIKADPNLSSIEKAEKLAEAAEQLATPTGAVYADMIATEALSYDSKNVRARFWKAALGPAMEMRGIVNRVAPLAKTRNRWNKEYLKTVKYLKSKTPDKSVRDFMFDGPQDIKSEADIQETIARVTLKMDEFRQTLKDLKNEELVIQLNSEKTKEGALNSAIETCFVKEVSPWVFQWENCELSTAFEVRLNRADFEAMQHVVAGYQIYVTALNAWDLSGVIQEAAETSGPRATEDVVASLIKNPAFGRIRQDHGLGVVPEMAKDLVVGVRYAMKMQSDLCPRGETSADNRAGYLFNSGFCVKADSALESRLRAVDLLLSGSSTIIPVKVGHKELTLTADAKALFNSPLANIRQLLPVKKNHCGQVIGLGDGTVGGALPTGDLNLLLETQASEYGCPATSYQYGSAY